MKPINVGLIGIGTVGGGTWTVLNRNAEEITRRAGRPIRITAVADRNIELAMQATAGAARITDDAFALVMENAASRPSGDTRTRPNRFGRKYRPGAIADSVGRCVSVNRSGIIGSPEVITRAC